MAKILSSKKDDHSGKFIKTHSMADSSEYQAWANAIYRCENKNSNNWDDYGGRGISVCHEWRTSFENFINDMGLKPSKNYSLDRVNVNGNYEPSNCRWASMKEQANNRTNTPRIEGMSLKELSEKTGISYFAIVNRKRRGWSDEKIINTPQRQYAESGIC